MVREPSYQGQVRITRGIDFRSGRPEQSGGSTATLAFTDYQDRFSEGGGAGSDEVAPWTEPTSPDRNQCIDALETNGYGSEERSNLPKQPGTGLCVRHGDSIVFARVTQHEPKTAVTVDAVVWG